jgi:Kdo2-lipid IVA lauroyltransferase/acyltransferase
MPRPRYVAEYGAARLVCGLLLVLPYRAAVGLGWGLAWIGFRLLRFRRRTAEARIREVFGAALPDRAVTRIAWLSWRNFVLAICDTVRLTTCTPAWIERYVVNWPAARAALQAAMPPGGPHLAVTPHIGSGELGAVMTVEAGLPVFMLTGRQKNALVDRYFNTLRGRTGIVTVQRGSSALRHVVARLRKGEILALMPDVRVANQGVCVPFLGKSASVPAGMAAFAVTTGAPIVPIILYREGILRHRMEVFAPIAPDPHADREHERERLTRAVFRLFDREIRAHPDQWFWFNKRWILDPVS